MSLAGLTAEIINNANMAKTTENEVLRQDYLDRIIRAANELKKGKSH